MSNLEALEHLRKARLHADSKVWKTAIDDAIYTGLVPQFGPEIATALMDWYAEYSIDESFPWIEKSERARKLLES